MKSSSFYILLSLIIMCSCSKQDNQVFSELSEDILYQNSFETLQDTVGFSNGCNINFVSDAPVEGNNQSLAISCGCTSPQPYINIGPFDEDNQVILSCWAKGHGLSGNLKLGTELNNYIQLPIPKDSVWQYYQSIDTLLIPKGTSAKIDIHGGGKGSGEIIIDLLSVVKVQ